MFEYYIKTEYMKKKEKELNEPIEEVIRRMYIDENKTILQIGKEIGLNKLSIAKWMKIFGLRGRRINLNTRIYKISDEEIRKLN